MRIFYASNTSPNASFQSNLWYNNLCLPLVDLGHDVIEFEHDLYETFRNLDPSDPHQKAFIDENRPEVTEELIYQVKTAHSTKPIGLFFSYFFDACVLPEAIDEIRAMGIKTVNWYCNGSYQLHLVSEIAPHYDWCLVPEKFRIKDYLNMGAKPIYCQEAANPGIYKPYDLQKEFDVTFVGQAYGDRPAYIKYLVDQGIDIRVWGNGWKDYSSNTRNTIYNPQSSNRTLNVIKRLLASGGWQKNEITKLPDHVLGGILADIEMIQMYSRTKINLGFSSCGETHRTGERILQVRLRDFEVPMSGGFYMVEYMQELEEFFDIGKEIVCYNDPKDLASKIKYYLEHDGEREVIRRAGYERCLRDHTWHKRFEMSFREMGLI